MATFKAVKYNTLQAATGQLGAIYNYYKARNSKVDLNVVTSWCTPIVGSDGTALVVYDDRIKDFPFAPGVIEEFNTNDETYFPNIEE